MKKTNLQKGRMNLTGLATSNVNEKKGGERNVGKMYNRHGPMYIFIFKKVQSANEEKEKKVGKMNLSLSSLSHFLKGGRGEGNNEG